MLDLGGGDWSGPLHWIHVPRNSHSIFFRTSLLWRIKPLPNWPDSNKIRQLYGGNSTEGDEIILASPILAKVMHCRRDGNYKRKDLRAHPYHPPSQGKPYVQGGFFGGTKVGDLLQSIKIFAWISSCYDCHNVTFNTRIKIGCRSLVGSRIFSAFQWSDRKWRFCRYLTRITEENTKSLDRHNTHSSFRQRSGPYDWYI